VGFCARFFFAHGSRIVRRYYRADELQNNTSARSRTYEISFGSTVRIVSPDMSPEPGILALGKCKVAGLWNEDQLFISH
jgi:hypothetical protein